MNGRVSKKLWKISRKNYREFYGEIVDCPFLVRLRIAWFVLTHHSKKKAGL